MSKRRKRKDEKKRTIKVGGIEFEARGARGVTKEFSNFLGRHGSTVPPWVAREKMGVDIEKFSKIGGFSGAKDEFFRKFYNKAAPVLYPHLTSHETYLSIMNALIRSMELKGDEKILSVGSGTGLIETFLAKRLLKQGKITMLDFSKGMNKEAKRIAESEGVKNVRFITADAKELPIKSKKFTHLISIDALHWVKKYPKAFNEMMRVMSRKPGSKLIFTFTPGHKRSDIDIEKMYEMVRKNNLEVTRVNIIPTLHPAPGEEPAGRIMVIIEPKVSKKAFKERATK